MTSRERKAMAQVFRRAAECVERDGEFMNGYERFLHGYLGLLLAGGGGFFVAFGLHLFWSAVTGVKP